MKQEVDISVLGRIKQAKAPAHLRGRIDAEIRQIERVSPSVLSLALAACLALLVANVFVIHTSQQEAAQVETSEVYQFTPTTLYDE